MAYNGISRIRKLVIALSSAITFGAFSGCASTEEQAQGMSDEMEADGMDAKGEVMDDGSAAGKKMKKKGKKTGKKMQKKMAKKTKKGMKKMKKKATTATDSAEEAMNVDGM